MKINVPAHLQAHCQSPTSQRYDQSFVKELANPTQEKKFKIFLPLFKEKIKTRQHTGDTDRKGNDKFNMTEIFDGYTDRYKNRQCITRAKSKRADSGNLKGIATNKIYRRVTVLCFEMPASS